MLLYAWVWRTPKSHSRWSHHQGLSIQGCQMMYCNVFANDGDVSSELVSWKSGILFLIVFKLMMFSLSLYERFPNRPKQLWVSLEICSICCDTTCPACLTKFSWSKQPQSGHVRRRVLPQKETESRRTASDRWATGCRRCFGVRPRLLVANPSTISKFRSSAKDSVKNR